MKCPRCGNIGYFKKELVKENNSTQYTCGCGWTINDKEVQMKVLDIITKEQLQKLRDSGFVVVHQVPTESMISAGHSTSEFHYAPVDKIYHRMVGESIKTQNKEAQ